MLRQQTVSSAPNKYFPKESAQEINKVIFNLKERFVKFLF